MSRHTTELKRTADRHDRDGRSAGGTSSALVGTNRSKVPLLERQEQMGRVSAPVEVTDVHPPSEPSARTGSSTVTSLPYHPVTDISPGVTSNQHACRWRTVFPSRALTLARVTGIAAVAHSPPTKCLLFKGRPRQVLSSLVSSYLSFYPLLCSVWHHSSWTQASYTGTFVVNLPEER
ncbi:hypothetical protein N7510_005878 [Penicillium lagena]|uniref:uncharacterized protein n=1 Tax=Penicillium lagena TaxID=94218 RepID=UPI0025408ABF|nr:uncharacterized protein N7510_005878 [Penicillium lagena]KAJ5612684.1 hypothetical protein N7510_005878 [Penicillium lagena]